MALIRGSVYARRPPSQTVCKFWATVGCRNKDCRFLHADPLAVVQDNRRAPILEKTNKRKPNKESLCKFWADGKCERQGCPFLHTWLIGDEFSYVTNLSGHKKGITGIVLPEKSSNLYSAAKDGTLRVWDCNNGQCTKVINLGAEAGCLFSKGVWVFCGATNLVKAWNTECNTEFTLLAQAVGQVHAMEAGEDMVFAGTEESVIYVWKGKDGCDAKANPFHPHQTLRGHTGPVLSLRVDRLNLYSGSMDHTIRVWNMDSLECSMVLNGHSGPVTSVICYQSSLLSCSLDQTIKVWCMSEGGKIEEVYSHSEDDGLLALYGMMHGNEDKSILLCSSNDNSVHLYDLPSFEEKGRLFAKREVRGIEVHPGGQFFTGDDSGKLSVWKWSAPAAKQEC